MFSSAFLVIVLAALASAKPVARSMQVHESVAHPPSSFALKGAAPADTMLQLRIALKQNDIAGLEKALMDVSTPGNALYGQHLSKAEVESYVAPKEETVSAVKAWLSENNIAATTASPAGDWLSFSIPVSKANSVFDADFSEYTHIPTGETSIRTLSYSIPTDLSGSLEFVHPTTVFAAPMKGPQFSAPLKTVPKLANATSGAAPASCDTEMTPTCLQELYGIPSTPATVTTNTLGVTGFIGQYANAYDLELFLYNQRTDMDYTTTYTLVSVDGGIDPQQTNLTGGEANLDIQYTVGIATDVPTSFISVGPDNTDGLSGFLDVINFLLAEENPPQVLTTSYGFTGELTGSVATNLCNAYAQLGARGTSLFFASGDAGVGSDCTDFVVNFPNSCPYITSVGATSGSAETSATFSGGGFSNVFARPSYQDAAVEGYLATLGSTNAGLFNASGRAYPDVAAMGEYVLIVFEDAYSLTFGTSCSTPIFASVVALLNDELAAAGKPPLGFLNPWLYSTAASALNDITTGNNPGCNTNGFPATTGWDPVTGLGTPNYAALRTAAGL